MNIYTWTAPRRYGFIAQIFLTLAWIVLLGMMIWVQATGKTIHPMVFIAAIVCLVFSGIITIALSQAIPGYWEDLETLHALQDEAMKARQEYETARDTLIKATLKEDYPTGEPTYD